MPRNRAVVGFDDFINIYTNISFPRHEHSENKCDRMEQGMEHTVCFVYAAPGPEPDNMDV